MTDERRLVSGVWTTDRAPTPEQVDAFRRAVDEDGLLHRITVEGITWSFAALPQPATEPPLHPDDGHEHRFTCIRCGVDPQPATDPALDKQIKAMRESVRRDRHSVTLTQGR